MKKNIKKNILAHALIATSFLFPVVSFAALGGVRDLLVSIRGILDLIIPVLFGLALIFFFWGVVQFILHSGEDKTREDGKKKMLWGIVALFVFLSISGILNLIGDTLDIDMSGTIPGANNNAIYQYPG